MTIDLNKEKLLCHMLLNDDLSERLGLTAPGVVAYWRGFIVQSRDTGKIVAKCRYAHADGNKDWTLLTPTQQDETAVDILRCGLEDTLLKALKLFGVSDDDLVNAVTCFYPPDDEGHPERTIDWLRKLDLIDVKKVKTPLK